MLMGQQGQTLQALTKTVESLEAGPSPETLSAPEPVTITPESPVRNATARSRAMVMWREAGGPGDRPGADRPGGPADRRGVGVVAVGDHKGVRDINRNRRHFATGMAADNLKAEALAAELA